MKGKTHPLLRGVNPAIIADQVLITAAGIIASSCGYFTAGEVAY